MKMFAGAALMIALAASSNALAYNPTKSSSFVPRGTVEPHATLSNKSGYNGKGHHAGGRSSSHKGAHHTTRRSAGSTNP
jgi:hypothetical protein